LGNRVVYEVGGRPVAHPASEDSSFEEFFVARRGALCRAAFFLTGDDTEAEELFQVAMVQAYARWSHIMRRGTDPEAYVPKIMLNKVRDSWRSMARARRRAHETAVRPPRHSDAASGP
jgi:DNA-directed RNA polymerase specialized sigma24 family protein